MKEKNP